MNFQKYAIVWQNCSENSKTADRFFVPSYEGYLPFFLYGKDLEAFEDGKRFEVREEHLLKGILYGLHEFFNDPKPWHQQIDKDTWLYLLDLLGNGLGFESPEKMILDVAYDLREKNGNDVSRIVLEVGIHLIP